MSSFQVLNQITDTNGVTHDIQCIHRVTMNTTTSTATAFVVNTSSPESVTNLYDGLTIVCKNTKIASATNCTLNLNGLGAKRIWLSQGNSYCTTHWALNQTYIFIYDEANTRWELQQGRDTDANNYDRNRYNGAIKCNASTAIVAGNIIVGKDGVFHHLKEGTAFDINYPILYANEAVAVNKTTTNTYNILHITITTTQSISMTAYEPVYIKGTLDGCNFTPISTTPLVQTVPIQEDEYYYILLGIATSATTLYLNQDHRIFAYKNGKFREIVNDAETVNGHTVASNVPSGAIFTDEKVTQTLASADSNRPLLMGYSTTSSTASDINGCVYRNNSIYVNPSTGIITANGFNGTATKANALSNTTTIGNDRLPIYIDATGVPQPCMYRLRWNSWNALVTDKPLGTAFYIPKNWGSTITDPVEYVINEISFIVNTQSSGIVIPIHVPCQAIVGTSSNKQNFRGGWWQNGNYGGEASIQLYDDANNNRYVAKLDICYINNQSATNATVDVYVK